MNKTIFGIIIIMCALAVYSCAPRANRNTKVPEAQKVEVKPEPKPVPPPPPAPKPVPAVVSLNSLSAKEKAAGWNLIFDGASTDGWHAYGSRTIGTAWKVANGAIWLDNKNDGQPKSGGDIITDKEYSNFEVQIDWRISKAGNSGICIFILENKDKYKYMWGTGPEIQIVDNAGHPDGKIFKHQAGDLYDLIPAKSHAENPPLEWNHYLIRCVNGKLDVYLNEVLVVSTTMWNDSWKALIANSKFKGSSDFGTYKKGHIGLQDHGDDVWFRNIKIREL